MKTISVNFFPYFFKGLIIYLYYVITNEKFDCLFTCHSDLPTNISN